MPEMSPDTLRVPCTAEGETKVRFASDIEERVFTVSDVDSLRFDVVLADGTLALTEIECVPPRLRFRGDYGSDALLAERDLRAELQTGTLDRHIRQMVSERKIPGLGVMVVQGQEVIFSGAYGLVDVEAGTPFTTDTPARIASATKVLSGWVFLSAVEDGLLNLEATLGEVLPEVRDDWKEIPLWRLLNHTSGIPTFDLPGPGQLSQAERSKLSHRQFFELIKDLPLDFEPGAQWRYQQSAYSLLAMILMEKTGRSWDELMAEHVLDPAATENLFYGDSRVQHPKAYTLVRGQWKVEDYYYPKAVSMGAGYNASVNDLARLFQALHAGKIVSDETFEREVLAPGRMLPDGYGLATIAKTFGDTLTLGHSGGGGQADLRYALDEDIGIAIISNRGSSDIAFDVSDEIAELLFGEFQPPREDGDGVE